MTRMKRITRHCVHQTHQQSEWRQSEASMMSDMDSSVQPSMRHEAAMDEDYVSIDELQNHGIGAADIQKLKMAGICTIKGVHMTSRRCLLKVKGLSELKVDRSRRVPRSTMDCGFVSALELSVKRQSVFRILTGSEDLESCWEGECRACPSPRSSGSSARGRPR